MEQTCSYVLYLRTLREATPYPNLETTQPPTSKKISPSCWRTMAKNGSVEEVVHPKGVSKVLSVSVCLNTSQDRFCWMLNKTSKYSALVGNFWLLGSNSCSSSKPGRNSQRGTQF